MLCEPACRSPLAGSLRERPGGCTGRTRAQPASSAWPRTPRASHHAKPEQRCDCRSWPLLLITQTFGFGERPGLRGAALGRSRRADSRCSGRRVLARHPPPGDRRTPGGDRGRHRCRRPGCDRRVTRRRGTVYMHQAPRCSPPDRHRQRRVSARGARVRRVRTRENVLRHCSIVCDSAHWRAVLHTH